MQVQLQRYSYRFADEVLNSVLPLKREIELVLTESLDVASLSRPAFNALLRKRFIARGWADQPQVFGVGEEAGAKMDFLKDRIGIEVGFGHASFIGIDVLKFQVSSYSALDKIGNCQGARCQLFRTTCEPLRCGFVGCRSIDPDLGRQYLERRPTVDEALRSQRMSSEHGAVPCGEDGIGVAFMNGCRREHRDARVPMLMIIPREKATKVRLGILDGSEAIGIVPVILERFERGF
jgi:hypothetical protein